MLCLHVLCLHVLGLYLLCLYLLGFGALGRHVLGCHTGCRQFAAMLNGSRSAEDLVAPGYGADHEEYRSQCGDADGHVDHQKAARQYPRYE